MKTVFSFNDSGIYIGEQECQLDPIATQLSGKEVYLIPGLSTEIMPPEEKPGYHRYFNRQENTWNYLYNHNADALIREKALGIKNNTGVALKRINSDGSISDITDEELFNETKAAKIEIIRLQREGYLKLLDILINEIILFNLGDEAKLAAADYRQALLDITSTIDADTDLSTVEWPELPPIMSL